MSIVMILHGLPDGGSTPYDGQYLASFDHEAHDGVGSIVTTTRLAEAKRFKDFAEALDFRNRVPACRPRRPDGEPNRPLTATNWAFVSEDSVRVGAL